MFEASTTFADEAPTPGEQASMTADARVRAIASLLRQSDALVASAISLLGRGGIEAATGLPPEMMLAFEARRTHSEARMMMQAAGVLREMPQLASAFSSGLVTWGQVRSIVYAVTQVRAADRTEIDELIAEHAYDMREAHPDSLVEMVDREAERRRADLALRREDRSIETSFLSIQGRLDGGSTIYGEADAESTAVIAGALDVTADAPVHPDEGPSRAQQRLAALVAICEATLSGGNGKTRPRPRFLATFDVAGLSSDAHDDAMVLLSALAGRSPRLSTVSRDTLLCDATIVPVAFSGAHPVDVGDAHNTFSDKVRTAVVARDRRCRFCRSSPASWCDVHGFFNQSMQHLRRRRWAQSHQEVERYGSSAWNQFLRSRDSARDRSSGRRRRSIGSHSAAPWRVAAMG
jgi:hypothetical protein